MSSSGNETQPQMSTLLCCITAARLVSAGLPSSTVLMPFKLLLCCYITGVIGVAIGGFESYESALVSWPLSRSVSHLQ